jgi:hypothetical protein
MGATPWPLKPVLNANYWMNVPSAEHAFTFFLLNARLESFHVPIATLLAVLGTIVHFVT